MGLVLGLDEVRHQEQGAVVAVGDDGGGEQNVEVLFGLVLADMAGRALLAVDGIGAMELDPVERDGEAAVEAQESVEGTVVAGGLQAVSEQGGEVVGVVAIEKIANGVVTRNGLDPEQGLTIGTGGLLLHAALEVEEGERLEEERREGTGSGVGDAVALVRPAAGIGQGGGGLAEAGEERLKDGNGGHILCFKAATAKSRAQKLVPHSGICNG